MKLTSATGATGFMIRTLDGYVFRVYGKGADQTFKDYDILHYDLEVTVQETDATFYETDTGDMFLDYSPETLGIKND